MKFCNIVFENKKDNKNFKVKKTLNNVENNAKKRIKST